MSMIFGALDPSPIRPPKISRYPVGNAIDLPSLIPSAGMLNMVTGRSPDVRVHGGAEDIRIPSPGHPIYCIAGALLPTDYTLRAREILRRLAYGFLDYSAREVVSRYHRDLRRALSTDHSDAVRVALKKDVKALSAILEERGPSTVGELVAATGMVQPNVSRTIATMKENGLVSVRRDGKRLVCILNELHPVNEVVRPLIR